MLLFFHLTTLKLSLRLQGQKTVEQLVLQHLQCWILCQRVLLAGLLKISWADEKDWRGFQAKGNFDSLRTGNERQVTVRVSEK